jgi:hypothetical protein
MKGRCADIPEEIYPVFRSLQPYKGGNEVLCALNQISNTDKHRILKVGIESRVGDMDFIGGFVSIALQPPWDAAKNEIELATWAKGHQGKCHLKLSLRIVFDQIESVSDVAAITVLDDCTSMVESILGLLEAESKRLGYFS